MYVHIFIGGSTTTSVPMTSSASECPRCGVAKKSGRQSCCFRGGAWFKNCGDENDKKFNHTWTEGAQACRGYESEFSVKSPLIISLHRAEVRPYTKNVTQLRSVYQPMNISHSRDISSDGGMRSNVCVCSLVKLVIWIYVLNLLP